MKSASRVFEMIHDSAGRDGALSVAAMCEMAGVSRSGYYAWLKAAPQRDAQEARDREDFNRILQVSGPSARSAKKIRACLLELDPPVVMNIKKIRRLLAKYGLPSR